MPNSPARNYLDRPLFLEKGGKLVYRTELTAAHERIEQLQAALNECRKYLETEMDTIDGPHNAPLPNRAMTLCSMIDETLSEEVRG